MYSKTPELDSATCTKSPFEEGWAARHTHTTFHAHAVAVCSRAHAQANALVADDDRSETFIYTTVGGTVTLIIISHTLSRTATNLLCGQ